MSFLRWWGPGGNWTSASTDTTPFVGSNRIHPRPAQIYPRDDRIHPIAPVETVFFAPGGVTRVLLNERGYPFQDLAIDPDVTVSTIEYQPPGGGYLEISAGSHADAVEAARFQSWTPTAFDAAAEHRLRITTSDSLVRTRGVSTPCDVRIAHTLISAKTNQSVRPFASASFAYTASNITAVNYEVSGAATVAKTAILRKSLITGAHDGAGDAAALTDTSADFIASGVRVGDTVSNDTDGSEATITAISTTTNSNDTLAGTLSGGTDDDWDVSDSFTVYKADDYITRVQQFEYKPTATGSHLITLYVTATGELSAVTRVEVSA